MSFKKKKSGQNMAQEDVLLHWERRMMGKKKNLVGGEGGMQSHDSRRRPLQTQPTLIVDCHRKRPHQRPGLYATTMVAIINGATPN